MTDAIFRNLGAGYWQIGDRQFSDRDGFEYLQRLLRNPGHGIHSFYLHTHVEPKTLTEIPQPIWDERALRAVRNQIEKLEHREDIDAVDELRWLQREYAKNTYNGKPRAFGNESEKARQVVTKSIKTAIGQLVATYDTQDIGTHLLDTIKTGLVCEYTGDWTWEVTIPQQKSHLYR